VRERVEGWREGVWMSVRETKGGRLVIEGERVWFFKTKRCVSLFKGGVVGQGSLVIKLQVHFRLVQKSYQISDACF